MHLIQPSGNYLTYRSNMKSGNYRVFAAMSYLPRFNSIDSEDIFEVDNISMDGGVTLTEVFNGNENVSVGGTIMSQLDIEFVNNAPYPQEFSFNKPFFFFMCNDASYNNMMFIGEFIPERPKNITDANVVTMTSYDYMQKFDVPANSFLQSLRYPLTLTDIYHRLCDHIGIGYDDSLNDALPNIMSRSFSKSPFNMNNNYSCRDILHYIAEACGCNARIEYSSSYARIFTECRLRWFQDTSPGYTVMRDDIFEFESEDYYKALTWNTFDTYTWNEADAKAWEEVEGTDGTYHYDCLSVSYNDGQELKTINYPSDCKINCYQILENPFLKVSSQQDINNYIAPLYQRLVSLNGYSKTKSVNIGAWIINAGDIVGVEKADGSFMDFPVFNLTTQWNGGATSELIEVTGNAGNAIY